MVSTCIAQNRITISRLFCIGALIALLLTEKMFSDRLIGNLLRMVGLVPIGIAMGAPVVLALYRGTTVTVVLAIPHAAFTLVGPEFKSAESL